MNHALNRSPLYAGTPVKKCSMRFSSTSLLITVLCPFLIVFGSLSQLQAQIAQRGSATTATVNATNSSTLSINKPTGVVAGDVLIASILQNETDNDNGGLGNATLTGWTLVDGRTIRSEGTGNGNNAWYGTVLYRVADGSEGSSFSFSLPNSRADMAIGSIVAFSGVSGAGGVKADGTAGGPFDIDPGTLNIASSDGSTASATGVTTSTANAAVVMLAMVNNDRSYSNWVATNPAALNELYDNVTTDGDDGSVGAAWAIRATSGATGNGSVTLSGSNRWGALFLVLKPAVLCTANAGESLADICQGGTSAALGGAIGGGATTGTWSDGIAGGSFSPGSTSLNATYTPASSFTGTVTLTLTSTGSSCETRTATKTLEVNPAPASLSASASQGSVCSGNSVNLSSSGISNSSSLVTLIDERFNGATNNWVRVNNTSGGSAAVNALPDWNLKPNNLYYKGNLTNARIMSSNDQSQFYLSISDTTGSTSVSTNTTLESPSFSTVGLSAASLSFYHYYEDWDGTDSIRVLISTNGGSSWTRIYLATANVGAQNAFANQVISLNSYLGFSDVKLQFNYRAKYGYFWALDNVQVTGTMSSFTENFENTATYSASGGSTKTGTSGSGDRPASTSFVTSPSTSYWINNGTATVTTSNFTGLTAGTEKMVSLRLASFSIGNTGNGADATDSVTVAISLDNSTYSNELVVKGNNNAWWGFDGGTGVATVLYDGNNSGQVFEPASGGSRTTDGFSRLQVYLPSSATQVRVRVTMRNNSGNEAWLIDDVVVSQFQTQFAWSSSPAGFTSSIQNPSGVIPTATTNYTVTLTNNYGCTAEASTSVTVNNVPSIATPSTPSALCVGGSYNPTTPSVTANGATVSAQGWQLETAVGSNSYASLSVPYTVAFTDNGKKVRYTATNGCGTTNSSTVTLIVNNVPTVATPSTPSALCSGGSYNPTAPSVTANGSTVSAQGWQLETAVGSNSYASLSVPYTVAFTDNGKKVRYTATNGCGTTNSATVTLTVNNVPATPGTISGSVSVCAGITGNSYSIAAVSGASSYTWSVPTGWAISAGQNTNSATITSGTAGQNGNISVTANNTCGSSTAATRAVTILANTWTGTQGTNWNTPGNWSCGTVPAAGSDIVISPTAANTPVVSSDVTIASLDIAAGKTFELNGTTVTINGAVTGEGSLTGSHTSSLVLNGNTGSLRFTQSGAGNFLKDLTINNGATASLANALNITGGTSANAEGTLTVNGTGVLTTNGNLTIKSNSFGTARIAANSSSSSYVSGAVTVERFIPKNTYKGWRLLAANTTGQTINQAWQEGQSGSTLNSTPGFGTMITGPAANDSVARTLGFDQRSVGYSMFRYDSESDALLGITNTNNTQLNAYSGYFLFIRGDRSPNQFGSNSLASTSTVLRSKGNLHMGTQASITVNSGRFVLAGNPYASAIDMRTVMATRSNSSISQSFQVWDPKLQGSYGFGAYQTLDYNPLTGNYEAAPGGGSFNTNNPNELNFIQSGSAFFIQNTGQSQGTITIAENAKAAGSRNTFRPTGNLSADVKFRTNLFAINANSVDLADGSIIRYADAFSNAVDSEDVVKNTNFGENFGLFNSGTELAVERRQLPSANDTIFYKMYSLKRIAYRLEFTPVNMPVGMDAFLEDAFTNSSTPVSLTDTSSYTFTVSTVAASAAQNRFRIVFRPQIALPVTVTEVKAYQQNNRVTVAWTVSNQTNLREYRVERSADGRSFSAIGTVTARNTAAASIHYQFDDAQALSGWNYYRIQCVDNDGRFKYTVVVKVMTGKAASSFTVYPNPVEGSTMNLQLVNKPAGRYMLRLLDADGRTVMTGRLEHAGGNATQPVALPGYVANGRYQLEIVGSENAPAAVIPVLVNNK